MYLTIKSDAGELRLTNGIALTHANGLHGLTRTVQTIDLSTADGAIITGSKLQPRDVQLRVKILHDVVRTRGEIIRICAQREMTLLLTRGSRSYVMPCIAQGVTHGTQDASELTINLYVPTPYWRAEWTKTVWIAGWMAAIEFPLEIPEDGIEFATRTDTRVVDVQNAGAVAVGAVFTISARSDVSNPRVYMAQDSERFLRIITDLEAGDEVTVNTTRGLNVAQMTIFRAGTGETQNAFSLLDPDSEFLQIVPGINQISYDADVGADALDVSIRIEEMYLGV